MLANIKIYPGFNQIVENRRKCLHSFVTVNKSRTFKKNFIYFIIFEHNKRSKNVFSG